MHPELSHLGAHTHGICGHGLRSRGLRNTEHGSWIDYGDGHGKLVFFCVADVVCVTVELEECLYRAIGAACFGKFASWLFNLVPAEMVHTGKASTWLKNWLR